LDAISQPVHKTIIFLHIEKTAGSTLSDLIAMGHDPAQVLRIGTTTQLIQTLSQTSDKRYTAILGHFFYGIHLFGLTYHPYGYYTMLRDPVDRLISQYYYIKRASNHHLHKILNEKNISLEEFALTNQHANQHIIRLGYHIHRNGNSFKIRHSGDDILKTAKHTLVNLVKHFGIFEYFDESIHRLSILLGKPIKHIPMKNVSNNRASVEDLDRSTLNTIRDRNALDILLYKYAKRVFESQKIP